MYIDQFSFVYIVAIIPDELIIDIVSDHDHFVHIFSPPFRYHSKPGINIRFI